MSDLNDLTKPDLQSAYANGDVPDTLLGHIKRLWTGDYTGMANLVPNMLRWAITGTTTLSARLYRRNASGQEVEVTVLPGVSIGGNAATATTSASCSGNAATASSAPASDVYSWAKQSTKPAYEFSEIGSKPTTLSGYGITDGGGLGSGQTWQNLLSSRALGVTYTNSTGKPICFSVSCSNGTNYAGHTLILYVDGVLVSTQAQPPYSVIGSEGVCSMAVVPVGSTYRASGSFGSTLSFWSELR